MKPNDRGQTHILADAINIPFFAIWEEGLHVSRGRAVDAAPSSMRRRSVMVLCLADFVLNRRDGLATKTVGVPGIPLTQKDRATATA